MASKFAWRPVVEARRRMAMVASQSADVTKTSKWEVSMLPSGLKIGALDATNDGMTTLGVMVKCGPLYENYNNLGISHALRCAVGLGSTNMSAFSIVRNIQHTGSSLDVLGSREFMMYTLTGPSHEIMNLAEYFAQTVASPAFKTWEVNDDANRRVAEDVASLDTSPKVVELLHKAAFRNGLGNSIYSPEFMAGKHKAKALADFHANTHTITRSALVGHGIDTRHLSRVAEILDLGKGHGASAVAKYYGGEIRDENNSKQVYVAIASEAASLKNTRDVLASILLKNILGTGPRVVRGQGAGKLNKAVAGVSGEKSVSGINYNYCDSGLIGAFVACEASNVGKVVPEVVGTLRSLKVTDAEVKAAKNAFNVELIEKSLNQTSVVESVATEILLSGNDSVSLGDILATVSVADVQAVASKLSSGKLSLAATGNLANLPYLDTL